MLTTFRILLMSSLRDYLSLFWSVAFPVLLLVILGYIFPSPEYRQTLLLGMIALSLLYFCLTGMAFEAVVERNNGIYKLIHATPYRTVWFIVNLAAARGVMALLSSLIVLVVGVLLFGIQLRLETVPLLVLAQIPGILCFTFIGLLICNLSQNEMQVSMIQNVVTLPMMFGSAMFYSLDVLPGWLRIFSKVLPLNYLIEAQHAAVNGDINVFTLSLLILLGITILMLFLAVLTFRWDSSIPIIRLPAKQV